MAKQVKELPDSPAVRDPLAVPPKNRPIELLDGVHGIRGFVGPDVGIQANGTMWDSNDPVRHPKPFGPIGICGSDRYRNIGWLNFPWKCVCQIFISRPSSGGPTDHSGSGVLISRRCVLTAGHVVFGFGAYAASAEVIPGYYSEASSPGDFHKPFGSLTTTLFRALPGWLEHEDAKYDLGIAVLPDTSLFDKVNAYFGVREFDPGTIGNTTYFTCGYPGDKDGSMWYTNDSVDAADDYFLYYKFDTAPGQSGSPIFIRANADQEAYAPGVITYAVDPCPNKGQRITSDVLKQIQAWVEQYG